MYLKTHVFAGTRCIVLKSQRVKQNTQSVGSLPKQQNLGEVITNTNSRYSPLSKSKT